MKQSLEDRWKSLRQQLKERSPLYQADEAACMRRYGPEKGSPGVQPRQAHGVLWGMAEPVWTAPQEEWQYCRAQATS